MNPSRRNTRVRSSLLKLRRRSAGGSKGYLPLTSSPALRVSSSCKASHTISMVSARWASRSLNAPPPHRPLPLRYFVLKFQVFGASRLLAPSFTPVVTLTVYRVSRLR